MKAKFTLFFICFYYWSSLLYAQKQDSVAPLSKTPLQATKDTLNSKFKIPNSSVTPLSYTDTLKQPAKDSVKFNVVYSKDSLDAPVDYGAKDSIIFDNKNNLIHLYGAAFINYRDLKLTASYIKIDMKNNRADAAPFRDSTGKQIGLPNFKDQTQDLTMDSLGYNFRTKKGIAFDVRTKQNDIHVISGKSKFISSSGDSTKKRDDVAYGTRAIFTTCNADHPHFGILSRKQKVIPNKLVVIGPSNLVIGDVPTPLVLPFGFFPLKQGKQTGLIFPRDYEYSPLWGFGLRNIGWYLPINDNMDATINGDIYVRGTYGLRVNSNFYKKYRFRGNVELGYSSQIREDERAKILRDPSWSIRIKYNQDQAANPNFNVNASVDMQGSTSKNTNFNGYSSQVFNDFANATRSQLSSNVGFTKTFPGKPYSLSGSVQHSQNIQSREVTMSLPNLNFQMQTIFPFKKQKRIGNERWYEKVALQYSSQLQNQIQTKDSLFFTQKMWDNLKFGVKHDASTNISFNILKYFNFSPSINYSEFWYIKEQNLKYIKGGKTLSYKRDTLRNPTDTTDITIRVDSIVKYVDTVSKQGFYRLPQFSMGASLNTRIFGTLQFGKGWLRAVRHTINPSIGFNYSPNYIRFYDSVQTNVNSTFKEIYSKYADAIYGTPSASGQQLALTYSFINLFEAKTFSKKDSSFKKTKLLEAVNINGSYNFAADSFKFSQVSMSTGTNFFKGLTTLGVNALFDPYGENLDGTRSKELAWKKNKRFLNFQNLLISLNTGISIGEIRKILRGGDEDSNSSNSSNNSDNLNNNTPRNTRKSDAVNESMIDLFADFRLNHQFSISRNRNRGRDTTVFQNALYTSGNINLTKKWRLTVGNIGYDFVQKQLTYPDFGIYRDLHCWEMGMNWQPIRGTYSFFLRVKPGTFDFLKIPYNKNVGDAFGTRR